LSNFWDAQGEVKKRLGMLLAFLFLIVFLLVMRLFWIQVIQADELQTKAENQWNRNIFTEAPRGSIYDRNGNLLASSSPRKTVAAIPGYVENPEETARVLSHVLDMEVSRLKGLLMSSRDLIYLKRKVEPEVAEKIKELELPGITFEIERKRIYPQGNLASQLIGFKGMDEGLMGLESKFEEELRGEKGNFFYSSDAKNRPLPFQTDRYALPKKGKDLVLTIDSTIQYILERELSLALEKYKADEVMGLAMDPQTGEILAVSSKPDFDPENYGEYDRSKMSLSPFTMTFEPGSTLKIATLMAAVEEGIFNGNETFRCEGSTEVADAEIGCWTSDRGGHGEIDFRKAVLASCNVGFMELGERLGKDTLLSYLHSFGFGSVTGIDYPGESSGIIFSPQATGPVELATTAFGQGVSVTPLQQVTAFSAIANGGYLMQPYLVKEFRGMEGNVVEKNEPQKIRQIISQETARQIADIMKETVEEGSGINASIDGYSIAGKTGTAQKVGADGNYIAGEFILSFVGFMPVEQPQIILYIAVDNAQRGSQWGSYVSAPIFHRVMTDVIEYKEMEPREERVLPAGGVIEIPDLKGLSPEKAEDQLAEIGLNLETIGDGEQIKKQTPAGGSHVSKEADIIAYIGDKILPDGEVKIPDLEGKTMADAETILGWFELTLESEGNGVVIDQYPRPGSKVEPGEKVDVIFSQSE